MATMTIRLPDDTHERLRLLARSRNISLNKLMEEFSIAALAEFDAETAFGCAQTAAMPNVGLRLWGDGLQVFAGAGGDLRKNTYRSIAEYNPYIQIRDVTLRNTAWRQFYGGLKGNLGWLEYQGSAA